MYTDFECKFIQILVEENAYASGSKARQIYLFLPLSFDEKWTKRGGNN